MSFVGLDHKPLQEYLQEYQSPEILLLLLQLLQINHTIL